MRPRVFILGIDGGTWKVIEPLIQGGWMPCLEELKKKSAYGVMWSTIPYITYPAWITMLSGRNPGHIGYFGFTNLRPSSYDLRYYFYRPDP